MAFKTRNIDKKVKPLKKTSDEYEAAERKKFSVKEHKIRRKKRWKGKEKTNYSPNTRENSKPGEEDDNELNSARKGRKKHVNLMKTILLVVLLASASTCQGVAMPDCLN